jgi:hypothetical protein
MALDVDSVQLGKQAALQTVEALRRAISQTITSTDRIPLRDELIEATSAAQDLDELEVRLQTGASAMPHLTEAQIAELQDLSGKLDQQIVNAQLMNLTLNAAGTVLESAVRVRDIVRGNIPA